MGMDVYGVEPTNDIGEYFRANCWYWRPLWIYVCNVCSDIITPREAEMGHYNDGLHIREKKAFRIADRLDEKIRKGEVAKYKQEYDKKPLSIDGGQKKIDYPFEITVVKEFAEFCKASGGFKVW